MSQALDDPAALRSAIASPAGPWSPDPTARPRFVLFDHALALVDTALHRAGVSALVVKGAALARTVYEPPWLRKMTDIDLVAPRGQVDAVVGALVAGGMERLPAARDRRWSAAAFGEDQVVWHVGDTSVLVEVHTSLDKLCERPVRWDEVWRRSNALAGTARLFVPSIEHHSLFVAQHLAASDFAHAWGWIDLEHLLRRGADLQVLADSARSWKLATAVWMCLVTLEGLGSRSVPRTLLDALRPGPLRLRALSRIYRIGDYPVWRRPPELGWRWLLGQTPLRDDGAAWLRGVARYGAVRSGETALSALERLAGRHNDADR